MGNCFSALVIAAVLLTILILIFQRPLLFLFGASENTIGYALDYMSIYAIGTIFVQLTLGMNMFISAQGFSKISMLTVVIGRSHQHHPGSGFYLRFRHGRPGRGPGYHFIPGDQRSLGHPFPDRT